MSISRTRIWFIIGLLTGTLIGFYLFLMLNPQRSVENIYTKDFSFRIPYFGLVYEGTSGNYIDNQVLRFSAYEKPSLLLMEKIAKKLSLERGTFLDIGANSGLHSLFMSTKVAKVESIEPFSSVIDKLKNNIKINSINNISLHQVGSGNKNGIIPFYPPPKGNDGVGSFSSEFSQNWKIDKGDSQKPIELPIVVGDEFLSSLGIKKIDLIKLDIEGYEKYALEGLKNTILINEPVIVMELNLQNSEGFKNSEEVYKYLPPNYHIKQIDYAYEGLSTGKFQLIDVTSEKKQKDVVMFPGKILDIMNQIVLD